MAHLGKNLGSNAKYILILISFSFFNLSSFHIGFAISFKIISAHCERFIRCGKLFMLSNNFICIGQIESDFFFFEKKTLKHSLFKAKSSFHTILTCIFSKKLNCCTIALSCILIYVIFESSTVIKLTPTLNCCLIFIQKGL